MAERLQLPAFLSRSLGRGHPWVYRDHVPPRARFPDGTLLEISAGDFSGWGIWDARSPIAVRMLSTQRRPDAAWIAERVALAWKLREPIRQSATSAYRWLFGEGDGIPGITVDLYAGYAVIVTYAEGLEPLVPWVAQALAKTTDLRGVVRRREHALELLSGRMPRRPLVVEEHGARFVADLSSGQKTGLFLDHRENRQFVAGHARGRRVLNLFSYTGAFSIHAALAGAASVTSVDVSAAAIEAARENWALNGLPADAHEAVASDVFEFLELANSRARRFDLLICDPPSFAKNKQQRATALKAYTRLNAMALRLSAPEAIYCAASCTSQVDHDAFVDSLAESARQAKRRLQIIHDAGHALDHPVAAAHPEGRYLKFVAARVLSVA